MKKILFILLFLSLHSKAATIYWVSTLIDNWNATFGSPWSYSSGGSPCLCTPTISDDVVFDANSGTATVTMDGYCYAKSINALNSGNTFDQTDDLYLEGALKIGTGVTWAGSPSAQRIVFGTFSTATISLDIRITLDASQILIGDVYQSDVTLAHDLICTENTDLLLWNGSYTAGAYNTTIGSFYCDSVASNVLDMGSATWTIIGSDILAAKNKVWLIANLYSLASFNQGTATVKIAGSTSDLKTFNPDGANNGTTYLYNKIWIVDGHASTYTINTGGAGGELSLNYFRIESPPSAVTIQNSGTLLIDSLNISGTAGNITSVVSGSGSYLVPVSKNWCQDYLYLENIDYNNSVKTFYAGCHSTQSGSTDIIFNNCGVACPPKKTRNHAIIIQ